MSKKSKNYGGIGSILMSTQDSKQPPPRNEVGSFFSKITESLGFAQEK